MKFLRLRKMSWAIIAWTAACLIWIVVGASGASEPDPECVESAGRELCDAATEIGTGIGVTLILALWFVGFLALSIIWFMTKPEGES